MKASGRERRMSPFASKGDAASEASPQGHADGEAGPDGLAQQTGFAAVLAGHQGKGARGWDLHHPINKGNPTRRGRSRTAREEVLRRKQSEHARACTTKNSFNNKHPTKQLDNTQHPLYKQQMNKFRGFSDPHTALRRRVQTPDPNGHREKREDMKAKTDTTKGASSEERAVSRRLRVSWWRPSADRMSAARPVGSVPKRGRPSSRSATHQSCVANRASERSSTRTDAPPRAGRPHVEPTDVYSCPPQEGGYSARGARKGESKEGGELRTAIPSAAPPTKHAVWRRVPRLAKEASGFATRHAQRLTPLRGRPRPVKEEAMEREGADVQVQGPRLRRGPVPTGPKTRPPD